MEKKERVKKEKPECEWFVEPDPSANQWIANELREDIAVSTERLKDANQKPHNVYQLRDHKDVTMIKKAAEKFGWQVYFWTREGQKSPIKDWTFENKKKKIDLKLVKPK